MKASTVYIKCFIPNPERPGYGKNASGTGFAVGDSRHVVTNHHVIAEGECEIVLKDGREISVKVLPSASAEKKDLAILELEKDSGLNPVTFASPRFAANQGQDLWAVGFPLGTPASSPEVRRETLGNMTQIGGTDVYELSSVLNHGNSGGPIFNACGEVIGIAALKVTADKEKAPDAEAIAFAIQES